MLKRKQLRLNAFNNFVIDGKPHLLAFRELSETVRNLRRIITENTGCGGNRLKTCLRCCCGLGNKDRLFSEITNRTNREGGSDTGGNTSEFFTEPV